MRQVAVVLLVAVVSDDARAVERMTGMARRLGHRVLAFSSPTAAADVLAARRVDVVVAFRRMTPVDGCELAARIQRVRGHRRPAFVLVIDPTDIFDTGNAFDAVLYEDFDRDALRSAVERALLARPS